MKKDDFGDRMKAYEVDRRIQKCLPTYMRLDGRSFSKFTKGLPRPFDPILSEIMVETTKDLVKEFKTDIAYTQSDEISLGWGYRPDELEFPLFSGRVQKLVSVIASRATAKFNQLCFNRGGEYRYRAVEMIPSFDARVFQPESVDSPNMELINAFLWREQDCQKNSVSMAARSVLSHSVLQNCNRVKMIEMMKEEGLDYYSLPDFFRHGSYIRRELFETTSNNHIPEQYRTDEPIIRSRVVVVPHNKLFYSGIKTADRLDFWFPNDKTHSSFNATCTNNV